MRYVSFQPSHERLSPFVEFDRRAWSRLAVGTDQPLTEGEIARVRGLGDRLDLREVQEIYVPLARLLHLYVSASRYLHAATNAFLQERTARTPFVLGIAGSVAVGKSTTARLLQQLLRRGPGTPEVELVTTDGFLYPNAELSRRGILERKGFPESYDRRKLLRFLSDVKSGTSRVCAPAYSHLVYDIVPEEQVVVENPDVLIVEGLNVLAPARPRQDGRLGLAVSDFFDFSIYVDARTPSIERWYVDRFLFLRRTAFTDPASYFRRYADLDDAEAAHVAHTIWSQVNEPNLVTNILPTRGRASLVLTKDTDHSVQRVLLRKI